MSEERFRTGLDWHADATVLSGTTQKSKGICDSQTGSNKHADQNGMSTGTIPHRTDLTVVSMTFDSQSIFHLSLVNSNMRSQIRMSLSMYYIAL